MPRAPIADISDVNPVGPVGAQFTQQASPAAFGAQIGQAEQGLGKAGDQLGDVLANHALALQGLQNETMAKEADIKASQALLDVQFNPDTGFNTKMGKDAVDGYSDAVAQIDALRQQYRATLPNQEAQKMFDDVFTRRITYAQQSMAEHAAQQNRIWMQGTNDARIANEVNQGAAYWNDDNKFGQSLATIRDEVTQRGEMLGQSPDQVQEAQTHYASEAWTARIRAVMATDPNAAQALYEANKGSIDAAHSAVLDAQIEQHVYTGMMRANALQAHQDVMAERQLRQTQANNAANLVADAVTGKPVDPGQLADQLRTGQISEAGFNGVMATVRKQQEGTDQPVAVVDLYRRLGAYDLSSQDVMESLAAGEISGKTAVEIQKGLNEQAKGGESQISRGSFDVLKTALGGNAIEKGLLDFTDNGKLDQVALWGEAQREWNQSVLVEKQDPQAVLADMLPRYQAALSNKIAASLPAPRFGALPGPNASAAQNLTALGTTWQATRNAFDTGAINNDQLQAEAAVLSQYQQFYQGLAAKQQIKLPSVPKPPPSGSSSGGGSKLVGVSTEDSP